MEKGRNSSIGYILTLIGGICWGFSGTCGQNLFMNKNASSPWLVPIRMIGAGIILIIFMSFREKGRVLDIWRDRRDICRIIIFGILGIFSSQFTYFTTIEYSNAGIATVLQYLGPALIMLYVCITEKRRPLKYEITALICSIAGVFIIATHGNFRSFAIPKEALFWGILSAISLLIYTVFPEKLIRRHSTPVVVGWGMLIGGIVSFFMFRPWKMDVIVDGETIFFLIVIIVVGTVLAYTFYMIGVEKIGPEKASMIACVEPVSATVFSALWLKSKFVPLDILGFVLILSTVFIITLNKSKKEQGYIENKK
ncbi:MAG: EamA family transporter [Firmicutes bacterium]|nr:EamA family transporter [Bacillota bacterium]